MVMTRRSLLIQGTATCLIAGNPDGKTQSKAAAPDRKLKIVFAGGHPGDPEYGCGGTIAKLTAQGHEVVLLYLNDGAWPPTSAAVRIKEAKQACSLLNARPAYAGQQNGHAIVDTTHYESYLHLLETEAPDAVFTHWMIDNHRDHRATAQLCYDAWQKSGRKYALYYYEVSNGEDTLQFAPTCYVDITKTESRKRAACYAHASQTPERYYALQDQVSAFRGLESGLIRAEAFIFQQQSPYDILSTR